MTALRVERVDGLVLAQDLGRPGLAHLGVPRSGALDPASLTLANRLVGNEEGAAGLEILLGGLRLVCEGSVRVALAGGLLPLSVAGRPAPWGTSVSVPAGSAIEVGRDRHALRGWLAVGGGLDLPPTLGSRSTDTLTGLGPPPLAAGDVLQSGAAGTDALGLGAEAVAPVRRPRPAYLGLWPGPRDDWFDADSITGLTQGEYEVTPASSRVALRLKGSRLDRRIAGELPSEGLVTGAVQVPGDGQPLVFLADHPTTGGYPVVGVVDDGDLAVCAQLRPGDTVRFRMLRR